MSLLDDRRPGGEAPPHTDDQLDYLLSAGRLGSAQRDRIFRAVAAATSSPPRRRFAARLGAALTGAAALAALVAVAVTRRTPLDGDAFHDKGAGPAPAASVRVACLRATLAACPRGSVLAFSVHCATADTLVTATMRPAGSGDTTSLLTNEPTSERAPNDNELLARGVRIPLEQPPGRYTIEVLLTRRSPSDVVARARFETTVSP